MIQWKHTRVSKAEKRLAGCLKGANIEFKQQVPINRFTVDFLVEEKLVVEVEGGIYHDNPDRVKRDLIRQDILKAEGYEVLRIPSDIIDTKGKNKSVAELVKLQLQKLKSNVGIQS